MGTGASAGVAAAAIAASDEDVIAVFKDLSCADRAKLKAALDVTADGGEAAPSADASAEAAIEIKARALNGESLAVLRVPASCTVGALKQKIAEAAPDAVVGRQTVICGDAILADDATMKDLQKEGMGTVEVQVILKDRVELKCDDLRVLLTEVADGAGSFESFGFEIYSFSDKRQYGTYELREATDEDKADFEDKSCTHALTLRFSRELKRKKFALTQSNLPVNMEKGTFVFFGEEE